MIRDSAVALIASRVGQRTDLNAAIILEMDLAIFKLEEGAEIVPWFLESESSSSTTNAGDERVVLPNDFILESENGTLWVQAPTSLKWIRLIKDDYDTLDEKFADSVDSLPKAYAISGKYFFLRPIPDLAYPIRMRYFAKDPQSLLTLNVENFWLKYAPDLVIAVTGAEVAKGQVHDMQLAASFGPEIAGAWERLKKLNEARKHTNMNYQMGDD